MSDDSLQIDFHGETLQLHPEHLIWWPSQRVLMISDVHLGKSATFRRHGIPVPEGETQDDLQRIEQLVARFQPANLLILGDLFHSVLSLTKEFLEALEHFFNKLPCGVQLVRGNHDPGKRRLAALRSVGITDELQLGPLAFVHDPEDARIKTPTITGHLHPLCRIGPKRGSKVRVPCFLHDDWLLTLPAFGTFTSGNAIDDPKAQVYPVVSGRVFATAARKS